MKWAEWDRYPSNKKPNNLHQMFLYLQNESIKLPVVNIQKFVYYIQNNVHGCQG